MLSFLFPKDEPLTKHDIDHANGILAQYAQSIGILWHTARQYNKDEVLTFTEDMQFMRTHMKNLGLTEYRFNNILFKLVGIDKHITIEDV